MSILTEVTPLEGIDLEGTPPCELLITPSLGRCGKLSVCRVHSKCGACGHEGTYFACARCRKNLLTGRAGCGTCGATRGITGEW